MCDFKNSTQLIALLIAVLMTNACSGGRERGNNKDKDQTIEQRRNGGNTDKSKEKSDQQETQDQKTSTNDQDAKLIQAEGKNDPNDLAGEGQRNNRFHRYNNRSNTQLTNANMAKAEAKTFPAYQAQEIGDPEIPEIKVEQVSPWVPESETPTAKTISWKTVSTINTENTESVNAPIVSTKIVDSHVVATKYEEKFKIKIIYTKDVTEGSLLRAQTEVQKNNYLQSVRKLYSHMNVEGAYLSIPIIDSIYEKTHIPTQESPYITVSLYQAIIESGACDINATGACLVVESDDRNNQNKKRAYFVTSSPENSKSKIIRVARQNLFLNSELVAAAETVNLGEKNQITVFSQVGSLNESRDLNHATYVGGQQHSNLGISNADMDKVTDEVISVLDTNTQNKINASLAAKSDRVDALAGHCFVAADLRVLRRFIGVLLPRTYIDDAGQKKYKPTKEGKGRLYCYKRDGSREAPKVKVQVIDSFISLGWRLSKGSEKFGAAALGWAIHGVKDILSIGSFRYLVSVDSSVSNAFWNYIPGLWKVIGFYVRANFTPIIWGGKKDVGGVLATAAGIGLNDNIWSEASVSLFGEIKIGFDPDDL